MKINCITKDGVKKNWWSKVWTIGAAGNGVYMPCRDIMRDCKRYDTPTTGHYEAWDSYELCKQACSKFPTADRWVIKESDLVYPISKSRRAL